MARSSLLFAVLLLLLEAAAAQRHRGSRTRTPPWFGSRTQPSQASPSRTQSSQGSGSQTQSLYGQCGGRDWTGPVICPTGAYCKNDGVNEWYSQCVSIEEDQPVDSGGAVTVTTVITYLPPSQPTRTTFVSATTITLTPDNPIQPRTITAAAGELA
ncbi:hypothetical protein VTK73DRAFT_7745 [Phialemonium thermophilum]|uniref:CBM1 domain-containing protein n=1 Tax=Phialemonium thermophilum TaxID=223376 RepID=A0ABR3WCP0_9PEZI